MGDMFRSEKMALCQMFIQPEAAYASIAELGETGCVQFRDLNIGVSAYQRKFVTEVLRCDNLDRQIRYIEQEMKKDNVIMEEVLEHDIPEPPNPREIIDLEAKLESIEIEIRELAGNQVNLKSNFLGMTELKQVLENTEGFFSSDELLNLNAHHIFDSNGVDAVTAAGAADAEKGQRRQLGFVAGVIKLERFFSFERMLWRISRGNCFVKRCDLNEPLPDMETGQPTMKTVFVAFFQGDQLQQRIKKVCSGFHAAIYPCPSSSPERQQMIKDVSLRLEDLQLVLNQTEDHRNRVLVAASRYLPTWAIMVKKMKAIYHILNFFNMDVSNKCLIGEGWVPTHDLPTVQRALEKGSRKVESTIKSFLNVIETDEQPPTYTRTNKFTNGFQNLIDAYGVASYREVNPALYTCITFPFLFAVMFGDIGHGIILLLFAYVLVWREKEFSKVKGEIFNIFFGGRYIIFLMGIFSVYTGLIYNDIFSKSMNIFGSKWTVRYNTSTVEENSELQLNPRYHLSGVYPIGMDPAWQFAQNRIIFLNSYKMKLSIIFGVSHMVFGVVMALINFNFLKKRANIILEFVPQILFLLLLFGYLVFMMFFKWVKYRGDATDLPLKPGCAPSILIYFINMMLFGKEKPLQGCDAYMFSGQEKIQKAFVAAAFICIPWMLLGKPIYIMYTRRNDKKLQANGVLQNGQSIEMTDRKRKSRPSISAHAGHDHGNGGEGMGELLIQQAIHTIEYVLSTISHTASYLRLWALSLAHAQLSEVLWNMVLKYGFTINSFAGSIAIFVVFIPWSTLTVGILVVIEGLSAFLHTLRLHWVEFMSKFYEGLGYSFQPFSFKVILEEKQED